MAIVVTSIDGAQAIESYELQEYDVVLAKDVDPELACEIASAFRIVYRVSRDTYNKYVARLPYGIDFSETNIPY